MICKSIWHSYVPIGILSRESKHKARTHHACAFSQIYWELRESTGRQPCNDLGCISKQDGCVEDYAERDMSELLQNSLKPCLSNSTSSLQQLGSFDLWLLFHMERPHIYNLTLNVE